MENNNEKESSEAIKGSGSEVLCALLIKGGFVDSFDPEPEGNIMDKKIHGV